MGPATDDIVRDNHVPRDDLDAEKLERAVVACDHVPPHGRAGTLIDAQPIVNDVVFDQRLWATAPDFDSQPLTARTAHLVIADDQLRRVVAEDTTPAGTADNVADDLVSGRTPGQADAAAPFRVQADVFDQAVGDAAARRVQRPCLGEGLGAVVDGALIGSQLAAGERLELIHAVIRVKFVGVDAYRSRNRILPPEAITRQVVPMLNTFHVLAAGGVPPAEVYHAAELVNAGVGVFARAEGQVVPQRRLGVIGLDERAQAESSVLGQNRRTGATAIEDRRDAIERVVAAGRIIVADHAAIGIDDARAANRTGACRRRRCSQR